MSNLGGKKRVGEGCQKGVLPIQHPPYISSTACERLMEQEVYLK